MKKWGESVKRATETKPEQRLSATFTRDEKAPPISRRALVGGIITGAALIGGQSRELLKTPPSESEMQRYAGEHTPLSYTPTPALDYGTWKQANASMRKEPGYQHQLRLPVNVKGGIFIGCPNDISQRFFDEKHRDDLHRFIPPFTVTIGRVSKEGQRVYEERLTARNAVMAVLPMDIDTVQFTVSALKAGVNGLDGEKKAILTAIIEQARNIENASASGTAYGTKNYVVRNYTHDARQELSLNAPWATNSLLPRMTEAQYEALEIELETSQAARISRKLPANTSSGISL